MIPSAATIRLWEKSDYLLQFFRLHIQFVQFQNTFPILLTLAHAVRFFQLVGPVPGSVRILETRPPPGSLGLSFLPTVICDGVYCMRKLETWRDFEGKLPDQRVGFGISGPVERFGAVHDGNGSI